MAGNGVAVFADAMSGNDVAVDTPRDRRVEFATSKLRFRELDDATKTYERARMFESIGFDL